MNCKQEVALQLRHPLTPQRTASESGQFLIELKHRQGIQNEDEVTNMRCVFIQHWPHTWYHANIYKSTHRKFKEAYPIYQTIVVNCTLFLVWFSTVTALVGSKFKMNIRTFSLTRHVIKVWSSLPQVVVEVDGLARCQKGLDKVLEERCSSSYWAWELGEQSLNQSFLDLKCWGCKWQRSSEKDPGHTLVTPLSASTLCHRVRQATVNGSSYVLRKPSLTEVT